MNDAERDAWLREALRHAPDSDAVPPSGVSEAILLKARAAARAAAPAPRRVSPRNAHTNPLLAFWDWLARPPVAAGFASVMAATLVGLMWWDQPIDEAMPRAPAVTRDRAAATPPLASTAPAPAAAPPATPTDSTTATSSTAGPRPMNEAAKNAAAEDSAIGRRQRSAPEQAGAADAKLAEPAAAPAKRSVDVLAKERSLPAEKKNEAPAPFPSTETQREMPSARKAHDAAAANDASKKDVEAGRSRVADDVERATATAAARPVAPPAAVQPAAEPTAQAPLASGRLAADERRPAATMESAVAAKAKSGAGTPPVAAAPAPPVAPLPLPMAIAPSPLSPPVPTLTAPSAANAPARDSAAAPRLEQGQSVVGGAREKDAAGFASATPAPAPAPFRSELERTRPDALRADASARTVPPARVLAAIAAEPERWLRQTVGGDTVALDAGWRAWLAELDAAAAGRWRPLGAAALDAAAAGEGTTTLRLVSAGRVAAIVRLAGSTVHVDAAPGTGADRWQATLVPAGAERLRSTARRLPP